MGFVKSPEDLKKLTRKSYDFYDAEFLSVYWETKPEIIKKVLPPPLKPAKHPIANAFVANYPKTNFGVQYKESALFVFAEYGGITGIYCLAMPVDNDMAMIGGRELFGYPKKMSSIFFKKDEKEAHGWVERHKTRYFEVKAQLTNKTNAKDALKILMDLGLNPSKPGSITYNYKFFRSPQYLSFDFNPRLVREEITMQAKEMKLAEVDIALRPSEKDPWSQIEVVKILGGIYLKTDSQMQPGEVVAEVEANKFEPYSFIKIDPY
jgi:acetoacetate decarboxylase